MTPAEQAIKRHLRHLELEGLSPNTIRNRRLALTRFARAIPVPLLDATPDHLYEWRDGLTTGNGTIAYEVSHIKSFYRWAVDERIIPANPVTAVPVPKLPRRLPRPIPEKDLMHALLLTTHAMPVRQWLVLAGWCGLRVGEIAGLRVENLRLHDTPPVVIVSAESAKGSKERIVELAPFVVREMEACALPLSGWAFTDSHGHPLTAKMVSRLGNDHLVGSGTKSKMHHLRHRFASQMYQETKDYQLVGNMLGHAPGSAHTANYAAFSRSGAAAAVAALPVPEDAATVNAIPAPGEREAS